MKKNYLILFVFLLTMLLVGSLNAQLAGTYSIGIGGDYTTLKLAFDDINANGISANVTLEIVDGHTEDDRFLLFDYAGKSSFDLLIRPEAGATSVILENTGSRSVLELSRVDNLTVDGRAGGVGDPAMTVRKVTGSFARAPVSLSVLADATAKVTNCILEYTGYGVQVSGAGDVDIENNHLILNSGASFYVRGINLQSFSGNAIINGNVFEGTEAPGILTYSGVYTEDSRTTYTASNNIMTMVASATTNAGGNDGYIAFDAFDVGVVDIFHNTIIITEGTTVPTGAWMLDVNPSGNMNVKNNIFELNTTSTSGHGFLRFVTGSGASNDGTVEYFANNNSVSTSSSSDANYDFYIPGQIGSDGADPDDFPAIFQKLTSETIEFTDAANGNYTLTGSSLTDAGVRSPIVTSTTTDFNGDVRDGTVPTKGAFEVPVPVNSTSFYDFEVPGFTITIQENTPFNIINIVAENPGDLAYTPSFVLASGATAKLAFVGAMTPFTSGTPYDVVNDAPDLSNELPLIITAPDGVTTANWSVKMSSINRLSGGTYSVGSGGDYETLQEAMKSIRSFGIDGDAILELKDGYSDEGLRSVARLNEVAGMRLPDSHGLVIRPESGASSVIFDEFSTLSRVHNLTIDGRAGGLGNPIMEINTQLSVQPYFNEFQTAPDIPVKVQYVTFGPSGAINPIKIKVDQLFFLRGDLIIDHCIFDDELIASNASKYIQVDGVKNLTISNNKFFNIRTSDSSPAITSAIDLISDEAESVNIYNNAITINARGTAAFYGIHAQSAFTGDLSISHNTIHFFRGALGSTGQLSGIVVEGDPSSLTIQNNIISNEGSEFSTRTGISWLNGTGTRAIEYNNVSGLAPLNYTDGDNVNTTEESFLAFEANSSAVSMTFNDEDNGDLSPTTDLLDNLALRTSLDNGIATDILGAVRRSNSLRGKGAYEIFNTDTEISEFSFEGGSNFSANSTSATITIDVPFGVNLSQITPEITIPLGASINPASNVERDFTNDVIYTVTSESGLDKVWTVSVNLLGLDGTYTVGSGGDFETLAEFISVVDIAGMDDRVTLRILDGHTETGAFVFDNLEETLFIRPETGVSTATFNGSFLFDNTRIRFLSESTVNDQQITINGTDVNAPAINLIGTKDGSTFSHLKVNYVGQRGLNLNGDGISVDVYYCEFNHTSPSLINVAVGVSGTPSMGDILVSNNKFLNFNGESSTAVRVYNTAYIYNNVIFIDTPGSTSPIGIRVVDGAGEVVIDQNTIHITGGASGQISGSVGIFAKSTASDRFEIVNNIISIDRLTNAIGSTVGVEYQTGSSAALVDHNHIDDYSSLVDNWLFGIGNSTELDISDFSNSTSSITEFTDADNGDLTLTGSSLQNDDLRSTFLPAQPNFVEGGTNIREDHNLVTRNTLFPSKGAFEYDNELANLLSFSVPDQAAAPVIDPIARTIDLSITSGASISQTPTINVSNGATISPLSGAIQNFATPVSYTVTSEVNTITRDWTVTINAGPISVDLDENEHDELLAANTPFTTFFVNDPNTNDTHTIELVSGTGDADNALFQIDGQNLINLEVFDFETREEYSIRLRATDSEGLFVESAVMVFVNDVNEAPMMVDQSFEIVENAAGGTVIGTVVASDPENGTLTFDPIGGEIGLTFNLNADGILSATVPFDFEFDSRSFSLPVNVRDGLDLTASATITVTVTDANEAPIDIQLSESMIDESNPSGTLVGLLSTTDVDANDTHTYSISSATDAFEIIGNELQTSRVIDFETESSFSIMIASQDAGGLMLEEAFVISVNDLPAQVTSLDVSNQSINENESVGFFVGLLTTIGEDLSGSFTYSFVSGEGDADNSSFTISNDQLLTSESFDFETQNSYSIRVMTDDGNLTREETFIITVQNVFEAPTDLELSESLIAENNTTNDVIGTLTTTDEDAGESFIYSLVSGSGDTDNVSFNINGNELRATDVFDFEAQSSYSIRVETNDGNGGTYQETFTIDILNENESISVASPIADQSFEEGFGTATVDLTNVFEDADGDDLTFTIASSDENVVTVSNSEATLTISEVSTGTATITVTADDGTGVTTSDMFEVEVTEAPLGFEDEIAIEVYPNPAIDFVNINANELVTVYLTDLKGQSIKSDAGQSVRINLSDLRSGIYILRITNGESTTYERIIKAN